MYGILAVPVIMFFCEGRSIYLIAGFRSEEELRDNVRRLLQIHHRIYAERPYKGFRFW
jgi:thioredoxin-like negative regulator of GroEL